MDQEDLTPDDTPDPGPPEGTFEHRVNSEWPAWKLPDYLTERQKLRTRFPLLPPPPNTPEAEAWTRLEMSPPIEGYNEADESVTENRGGA